jgi:aryl-alcohol dehydrogenase-like predicted oxidoreductase
MADDLHIKMRSLGQTGLKISPIGLGTNKFSGGKGLYGLVMPDLSQEDINEIINSALAGGINWFDTAEIYGFGRSEQAIAKALKAAGAADDEVVIVDKWLPLFRTARSISRTIDKRLNLLGDYAIDLYMVHNSMGFSSPEAEMEVMANLVEAGKIRSVGVSNFNASQMKRAHGALTKRGLPLAANQVEYSLLNRKIETNGVLNTARELGMTIIAWAPLGSGLLTGKYHAESRYRQTPIGRRLMLRRNLKRSQPLIKILEEIAADNNATAAQIAVNWLINFQGDLVVAIPGASKAHHAEQSASAMNIRLSDNEMNRLDNASLPFR